MSSSVQLDGQIETSIGREHLQKKTPSTDDDWIIDMIIGSVTNNATDPPPASPISPRAPVTMMEKVDYEVYFFPKLVSIGPYHVSNKKLWSFQMSKLNFARKLLGNNRETLANLFQKLSDPQIVHEIKGYYEQDLTTYLQSSVDVLKNNDDEHFKEFTIRYEEKGMTLEDFVFTKMMLLDSCFILYFIRYIFYEKTQEAISELGRHEIFLVLRDLFLLENQIPFKVLEVVIELIDEEYWLRDITQFIITTAYFGSSGNKISDKVIGYVHMMRDWDDKFYKGTEHLLGAVHDMYSSNIMNSNSNIDLDEFYFYDDVNFRKASELVEVGIDFKPIKGTLSLTRIEFVKSWWRFAAKLKLPRIKVNHDTKPMILNLIAYERCKKSISDSWVTSYVCLLDRLIDDAEDAKVLRKAWVIDNFLSSDKEVADLINDIATGLRPNRIAYYEATKQMQAQYRSRRNALYWQLKNEYFKSPWAGFALLGALIALFLTAVQTYYTAWIPRTT